MVWSELPRFTGYALRHSKRFESWQDSEQTEPLTSRLGKMLDCDTQLIALHIESIRFNGQLKRCRNFIKEIPNEPMEEIGASGAVAPFPKSQELSPGQDRTFMREAGLRKMERRWIPAPPPSSAWGSGARTLRMGRVENWIARWRTARRSVGDRRPHESLQAACWMKTSGEPVIA